MWGKLGTKTLFGFFSRSQANPARRAASSLPGAGEPSRQLANLSRSDDETSQLAHLLLEQHRFALLLRPQIASSLSAAQHAQAMSELQRQMSLVPAGNVLVRPWQLSHDAADDEPTQELRIVQVEAFYLDRFPVTNQEFFEFVAAGGYEQSGLWDEAIWNGVCEFRDRTQQPGPRFWQNGHFPLGEEDHPVVGVSWYEATAYARWIGKRLPTDAEWVKAASWPVSQTDSLPTQRKFPWGDTADHKRANLWGSGPERVVSVHEFADGVSIGGCHQLIGNVWEWTASNFAVGAQRLRALDLATPLKSVRGGAFDTYFDSQANTEFQSGEAPLARRHNVGFRLAIGVCDVAETPSPSSAGTTATTEPCVELPA